MAETEIVEAVPWEVDFERGRVRPPLGITLTAALLAILGLGSVGAGSYLLLATNNASLLLVVTAVATGPAILFLSYHLLRLAPWTWRTLIAALILLSISSIVRLVVTPGLPTAALSEILIEAGSLFYLTRHRVRDLFAGTR